VGVTKVAIVNELSISSCEKELRAGSLSGSKPRVRERERERENVSEKKKLFVYKSAPS
jgi:hypothetical protein